MEKTYNKLPKKSIRFDTLPRIEMIAMIKDLKFENRELKNKLIAIKNKIEGIFIDNGIYTNYYRKENKDIKNEIHSNHE